jgi:hypothetical protein
VAFFRIIRSKSRYRIRIFFRHHYYTHHHLPIVFTSMHMNAMIVFWKDVMRIEVDSDADGMVCVYGTKATILKLDSQKSFSIADPCILT